jgi:hypothetical protein
VDNILNISLSERGMAKQFLLDKARRTAYNKARQHTVRELIHKYQSEYDESFTKLKTKQESIELEKIKPQLEALEEE